MLSRRELIRTGALAAGSLSLAPAFFRSARAAAAPVSPGAGPYGPLGPADLNGIRLPTGFTSRVIGQANLPVADTGYVFPLFPDGSATYATSDGGWILAVNSEVPSGGGGASGIRFAADGSITDAYRILGQTSGNCAGGKTPWGTWMSCEEVDDGITWECDPTGTKPALPLPAMGVFKHEAVAVDPAGQQLYLTEDLGDGGLYRFTPEAYPDCTKGLLEVAIVGAGGKVTWARVPDPLGGTANPTRKQVPGMTQFKRGEGIWFDRGVVYVSTTSDNVVHAYDTATRTLTRLYDAAAIKDPPMINPDNVTVNDTSGEIFVGEDDGGPDPLDLCVITPEGTIARFLKLTGPMHGSGEATSEVTGPSFSPDGKRLYFSSQRAFGGGLLYEVTGPFRTTRPAVASIAVAPPRPAIGFEVPRRLRRTTAIRSGVPVGLTLDRAASIDLRLVARVRTRPGAPLRRVVIARLEREYGRGARRPRLVLTRRGKALLRGRRKPLTTIVELRIRGRVERRKLVLS